LFYWAKIHQTFKGSFHWEALLNLANHYNGKNEHLTHRFSKIDKETDIGEILSHYIYLEEIKNPDLAGHHACYFYHDLIATVGISQPLKNDWKFDDYIIEEIFDTLMFLEEYYLATSIYRLFKERFLNKKQTGLFKINEHHSAIDFHDIMFLDYYYKNLQRHLYNLRKNSIPLSDVELFELLVSASAIMVSCACEKEISYGFLAKILRREGIDTRGAHDLYLNFNNLKESDFQSSFTKICITNIQGYLNEPH
jgi:hypothetical protein